MFSVKDDCFSLSCPSAHGIPGGGTLFIEDRAYFLEVQKDRHGEHTSESSGGDVKGAQLCFLGVKDYYGSYG